MDIEALGYVSAAALTQPIEPKEPPLRSEADLFSLTIEQLLPIRSYVLDPTRASQSTMGRKPKVTNFFRKKTGTGEVALKLLANLEEAKKRDLWRILVSLPYGTLDRLQRGTLQPLWLPGGNLRGDRERACGG